MWPEGVLICVLVDATNNNNNHSSFCHFFTSNTIFWSFYFFFFFVHAISSSSFGNSIASFHISSFASQILKWRRFIHQNPNSLHMVWMILFLHIFCFSFWYEFFLIPPFCFFLLNICVIVWCLRFFLHIFSLSFTIFSPPQRYVIIRSTFYRNIGNIWCRYVFLFI